jgi:hypothetical protein
MTDDKKNLAPEESVINPEMPNILDAMVKYGGGFVRCIALAYHQGDKENRQRLLRAFPDLFTKYLLDFVPKLKEERDQ